jgi:hypothetical protein
LKRILAAAVCLAGACAAHAAPMGFKGAWMSMGDFSADWRELSANYALTPRDALGFDLTEMRGDAPGQSYRLLEATYTRLLHRWNLPHAQANVWFIGGLGTARMPDGITRALASPGVSADYETTRVYVSAMHRLYRADGLRTDYDALRAGFSFYETDYEQTQPWLIVEARRMGGLNAGTEITPMLRLINKNYFVEAGVSDKGRPRFNFMYIF